MKFTSLVASVALLGLFTVLDAPLKAINPQLVRADAAEMKPTGSMSAPDAMKKPGAMSAPDAMKKPGAMTGPNSTTMTLQQKIALITQTKGKPASAAAMRQYFGGKGGDLTPIGFQPGGAGMVVNLYNKANNVTFSYCATYDVVVAVKTGKVTQFLANEVK